MQWFSNRISQSPGVTELLQVGRCDERCVVGGQHSINLYSHHANRATLLSLSLYVR